MKSFKLLLIIFTILRLKINAGGDEQYYLTFCNHFYDIYDSSARYQGTSCFLNIEASWDDAKVICEANKMFLLKVVNSAVQSSIFYSAASIYGIKPIKSIWVNTKKDSSGIWRSYDGVNFYKLLGSTRLSWVNSNATNIGNCMVITNQIGQFKISSKDCNAKLPFICTFNRTNNLIVKN